MAKRKISADARLAMSEAQKARWARIKGARPGTADNVHVVVPPSILWDAATRRGAVDSPAPGPLEAAYLELCLTAQRMGAKTMVLRLGGGLEAVVEGNRVTLIHMGITAKDGMKVASVQE